MGCARPDCSKKGRNITDVYRLYGTKRCDKKGRVSAPEYRRDAVTILKPKSLFDAGLLRRLLANSDGGGFGSSENFPQFAVGRNYDLRWRVQYPHPGGMQINLFNAYGQFVERIAPMPASSDELFDNEMRQNHHREVMFTHACYNCILQVMKQGNGSWQDNFNFVSCADVDIVESEPSPVEEVCQARGNWSKNGCECEEWSGGEHCTAKEDCRTDADCGRNGVCRQQENMEFSKICYCPFGRFGRNCEFESKFENDKCLNERYPAGHRGTYNRYGLFNDSCYIMKRFNSRDRLFWRHVGAEEIEIIADFQTRSFLALGWRPLATNQSCHMEPKLGIEGNGFLPEFHEKPLHPMHCTDIVWGSVVNDSKLHIRDAYSRDKSTPLSDENFAGGKQSFSVAVGLETDDGRTVIGFRRKINTDDPADHPLGPERMHGIYAKGQKFNETKYINRDTLRHPDNAGRVYIRDDEFTYHGTEFRGFAVFKFAPETRKEKWKSANGGDK